jgi:hypothetical protein
MTRPRQSEPMHTGGLVRPTSAWCEEQTIKLPSPLGCSPNSEVEPVTALIRFSNAAAGD